MKCRLCNVKLDDKNSCKAHIFPRCLLKSYSKEEFGNLILIGTNMDKKRRNPQGVYDDSILCSSCDGKLGVYDNYALNFVNNSVLYAHPSGTFWTIDGVNQQQLKLFCLSYMWRASIINRPEFSGINLGFEQEEALKRLLDGCSVNTAQYPVVLEKFNKDEDLAILTPAINNSLKGVTYFEAYLPKQYKIRIKVDAGHDEVFNGLSLGNNDFVIVRNLGDFNVSGERLTMIKAANNSQ